MTTVAPIDDELPRRAKSIAALNGETLKALIENAITEYVERLERTGNLPGRARRRPGHL